MTLHCPSSDPYMTLIDSQCGCCARLLHGASFKNEVGEERGSLIRHLYRTPNWNWTIKLIIEMGRKNRPSAISSGFADVCSLGDVSSDPVFERALLIGKMLCLIFLRFLETIIDKARDRWIFLPSASIFPGQSTDESFSVREFPALQWWCPSWVDGTPSWGFDSDCEKYFSI